VYTPAGVVPPVLTPVQVLKMKGGPMMREQLTVTVQVQGKVNVMVLRLICLPPMLFAVELTLIHVGQGTAPSLWKLLAHGVPTELRHVAHGAQVPLMV
jgi:hypothetical protein